jgi:hypothetical protein
VLSSGIVLAWPHGADLKLRTGAALAAATALASAPAFPFEATAELSTGGAQSTEDNVLTLIPLVL